MATDRDEQLGEQQRQQQELEEIRRSFAEMGARMGSLFEPAEVDEAEPAPQAERKALPAPPPAPPLLAGRPRWWWAAALTLLFLAGGLFGYLLPRGDGGPVAPAPPNSTTAGRETASPPETVIRTVTSVPDSCLDTAEKGDEVIARLTANIRDNRLAAELRDYTIASQACRKEASP